MLGVQGWSWKGDVNPTGLCKNAARLPRLVWWARDGGRMQPPEEGVGLLKLTHAGTETIVGVSGDGK